MAILKTGDIHVVNIAKETALTKCEECGTIYSSELPECPNCKVVLDKASNQAS